MIPQFETEIFRRIYDNNHGCYYQIGPDFDGLACVEVRYYDENNKHVSTSPIMASPDCMILVGQAIIDCAKELQELKKKNKS